MMAKGHRIEGIPEVPLVVSDKVEEFKKTKEAVTLLRKAGAWADIDKVIIIQVLYEQTNLLVKWLVCVRCDDLKKYLERLKNCSEVDIF